MNISNKQDLIQSLQETNKRLERKIQILSELYQISDVVTSEYDVNYLSSLIIKSLKNIFSLAVVSIMLFDEKGFELRIEAAIGLDEQIKKNTKIRLGEGIAGWVAQTGESLIIENIEEDKRFSRKNHYRYPTNSFLSLPLKVRDKVIGVINLSNEMSSIGTTKDELKLLSIFTTHFSIAIENIRLYEKLIKEQKIKDELEIAAKIQRFILPKEFPKVLGIDISAINSPSNEMGGDFYDCFMIDKDKIGFVIGDVSGKSIPAALFMIISKYILRAEIKNTKSIQKVIANSNELITEESLFGMFVTVFYAIINIKEKTLEYINAGHNRQIIYHSVKDKWTFLTSKGKPLGISKEFYVRKKGIVNLYPNDIILLFTDGVIESINDAYEEFSETRLLEIIRNNHHRCAQDIIKVIEQERKIFCNKTQQFDDLTMMAIKIGG